MYITNLMQAEREFRKLTAIKLQRSTDPSLSKFYQNKNFYEHLKCRAEHQSYLAEIEQIADDHFPLHLSLELCGILNLPAL
jgi:hypothetical protein